MQTQVLEYKCNSVVQNIPLIKNEDEHIIPQHVAPKLLCH